MNVRNELYRGLGDPSNWLSLLKLLSHEPPTSYLISSISSPIVYPPPGVKSTFTYPRFSNTNISSSRYLTSCNLSSTSQSPANHIFNFQNWQIFVRQPKVIFWTSRLEHQQPASSTPAGDSGFKPKVAVAISTVQFGLLNHDMRS